jgi:hypothetical protein
VWATAHGDGQRHRLVDLAVYVADLRRPDRTAA